MSIVKLGELKVCACTSNLLFNTHYQILILLNNRKCCTQENKLLI